MSARRWTGCTRPEDADAYERLVRERVLPGLQGIDGYRGGYVPRRDEGDEVEVVVSARQLGAYISF